MTYKLIIAGGREFKDYELLSKTVNKYYKRDDLEIVSGTARGADKLGERFAEEKSIPVKHFPADWDAKGKAAGYIRNAEMAEYADALLAFWDGSSKGTSHMIDLAHKNNLHVSVVNYKKD
ncbi:putative Mycobacteriophage D29, Gp61 [Vibrio phage 464E53-1]|nr:putative Mycobacteriophage D29, Gp61 [Vibrio phage 464E53-1]